MTPPAPSHAHVSGTTAGSPTLRRRVAAVVSFTGRYRILHLTWFAFFLTFVVWFNFAPFANTIAEDLGLSDAQKKTIGLCNVALTVPARVFIGMALDRWGPRRVFGTILLFAAVPNTVFAFATSFEALVVSRLALSVVGAGFVVGIRMVSEWFPPREVGTAEGIYGGWGNFGSAFAAFSLPVLAGVAGAVIGGDEAWRYAIAATGLVAAGYGVVYLRSVTDTPDGVDYNRPARQGALEVTSRRDVFGLALLTLPINAVLGLIAWRVWREDVIGTGAFAAVLVAVAVLFLVQELAVFRVNAPALAEEHHHEDRYPFSSVAALCVAYFATFGSELAVVTMLPGFFADTWGLGPAVAGVAASAFAFMNLAARPIGGMLSDGGGSRTATLRRLLLGLIVGYVVLSTLGSAWPWPLAIVACMGCSFFVQSGEGAVYSIVPLVKKRVSGQVAGLVGASGNVGAVVFLTANILVDTRAFFLLIAGAAVVARIAVHWMAEPAHSFDADLVDDRSSLLDRTDDSDHADPSIGDAASDSATSEPALVE